jgi:hypothetical protein
MPRVPTINRDLAESLIDLIVTESQLEKSQFIGATLSDTPISTEQIEQADKIFKGTITLQNGGPPCISCHSTGRLTGFSGGRIGPDLTRVYERYGGRQSLATFLLAPTSSTMSSQFGKRPFTSEEVLDLAAFLEDVAKNEKEKDSSEAATYFLLFGLLTTGLFLSVIGAVRRRRIPLSNPSQSRTGEN